MNMPYRTDTPFGNETRTEYQERYTDNVNDAVAREAVIIMDNLPVPLTDAEVLDVSRRNAEIYRWHWQIEQEMKDAVTSFKSRLKVMEAEMARMQDTVRSGIEWRSIQCEKAIHRDLGEVTITRLDTGRLIETRPMTTKERQVAMELS